MGAIGSAIPGTPLATRTRPTGTAIEASETMLAVDESAQNAITLGALTAAAGALARGTPVANGTAPTFVTFDRAS